MFNASNKRPGTTKKVPPQRLLGLLRQAVAYQMEFSRYHPQVAPKIHSYALHTQPSSSPLALHAHTNSIKRLLEDYSPFILPNALKTTYEGHLDNVKCVEFVGADGVTLASGSRYAKIGYYIVF